MFFHFVAKHACDRQADGRTNRQTDRQNNDLQDRASIAASRRNNLYATGEMIGCIGQL